MANLKQLRLRIKTIKSTKKITKAMQMVSASKLRKSRIVLEDSKPYYVAVKDGLNQSLGAGQDLSPLAKVAFGIEHNSHTRLLIVIGSDRGLCGSFNNGLLKLVKQEIFKYRESNVPFKIISIGKKPSYLLNLHYPEHLIEHHDIVGLSSNDLIQVIGVIVGLLQNKHVGHCEVYFNEFRSVLSQVPTKKHILPLGSEASKKNTDVCELEGVAVMDSLINMYLIAEIQHMILESRASEEASRTTAMENATRNAGDIINKLTIVMNRTRQAVITKELIEIISGAEAV